MKTKAIVAREPKELPSVNWGLEEVEIGDLGEKEVLIEMVASGICHTDLVLSSVPAGNPLGIAYPKILGHEGAGYVREVGGQVKSVGIGDPVLLSFYACSTCDQCVESHPAYCDSFNMENYIGRKGNVRSEMKEDVWSRFFGHSSFSKFSVVAEESIVNVKDIIRGPDELKLFAPLGCGFQTGVGAVTNIAMAKPNDSILILGLGAVGMGSLMTAKLLGLQTIIAVDRLDGRINLSRSLGATHTIDTSQDPTKSLAESVAEILPHGASIVIETTGVPALIEDGLKATRRRGKLIQIGIPPFAYTLNVPLTEHIGTGRSILGCIEGDSIPKVAIPQMIDWYRSDRFPIDKLITYIPAETFQDALQGLKDGRMIKPVLVWS